MRNLIEERVYLASEGENPYVISKFKSDWAVIGDALLKVTESCRDQL